jgi:uncharacterized membrane protein
MVAEEGNSRELDRLIFFSDAVFAIVMTLLVLDIRVPDVPSDVAAQELPGLVFELWPKFFSYVLSFFVVGLYWIAHHQTFRYVRSYDRTLLWLNLAFLLSVTFVPFPTDLLGEYGELRFSVIFYAISLGMVRLLLAAVWWYVTSSRIRTSVDLDRGLARFNSYRGLVVPVIFFLSAGVALVSPNVAAASWVLLFVVDGVLWRLWRRLGGTRG